MILCTFEVRKKPSGTPCFSINWFVHSILENQIQGLSRTFRHRFKDFQGPARALDIIPRPLVITKK